MEDSVPAAAGLARASFSSLPPSFRVSQIAQIPSAVSYSSCGDDEKRSSLIRMGSQRPIMPLALPDNGSTINSSTVESGRIGEVKRVTRETNVSVKMNLDGSGVADSYGDSFS